jgi:hypothetical protein
VASGEVSVSRQTRPPEGETLVSALVKADAGTARRTPIARRPAFVVCCNSCALTDPRANRADERKGDA